MEVQWESFLTPVFREELVKGIVRAAKCTTITPQTLANLMYALSLLVFDVSASNQAIHEELADAHLALLDSIRTFGVSRFSEKEREQILMYIHVVRQFSLLKDDVVDANQIFRVHSSGDSESRRSRLQESVVASLCAVLQSRNNELLVADEYSAFGGAIPVDATIFQNGNFEHPLAFLEVNGPHHYRNGILRRKDKLKEMMYRKKYPLASFTRVSYDQVRILGTGRVAFAIANFITLTSSHTDTEKMLRRDEEMHACSTRNAERELYKILSLKSHEDSDSISNFQTVYSIFGDVTWSTSDLTRHLVDID